MSPGLSKTIRAALPYLRRHRGILMAGLALLLLKEGASVALPWLAGRGIDALAAGQPFHRVLRLTLLMLLLAAAKAVLQFCVRLIFIGVSREVEFDLRNSFFHHMATLPPEFYMRWRTGDLMARATNDLNAVRLMIGPAMVNSLDAVLAFIPAFMLMSSVDLPLTLLALAPSPLIALAAARLNRLIYYRFGSIQECFSRITSRVHENIAAVRLIRAFAQEREEERQIRELSAEYVRLNLRLARVSGFFAPLLQFLMAMSVMIVLWAGGSMLIERRITLGEFVMFNTFLAMLMRPMVQLGRVANLLQRGKASLMRIEQVLNERPAVADPPPAVLRTLPGRVEGRIGFHHVSVAFRSVRALEDVCLSIPAGSTAAIVGPTGSGKSTLAHLIPRLLDPVQGSVTLDGIDLRHLPLAGLREQIGFVPQETFLFSASVAENIAIGVRNAKEADIVRAAEIAGLGPDLASFPAGLQTMVGERGITLSGGQKQRVALARALMRNPAIVLLDDAFASVDGETEARILARLREFLAGRTTILISHRAGILRLADRIFVLHGGRLQHEGSHAELIAQPGYYSELCRRQLQEEQAAFVEPRRG